MRRARAITASLAAGVLISAGVAWAIGAFAAFPRPVALFGDDRPQPARWPVAPPAGWGRPDHGGRGGSFGLTSRWAAENWNAWTRWRPGDRPVVRRTTLVYEYGWPMRCLRSRFLQIAPRDAGRSGNTLQTIAVGPIASGWAVPDRLNPAGHPYRRLALEPMPLGLAVNTVGYALVAWVVWAGPRRASAWWRTRRGRCAGCGYPLAGLAVCPECGRASTRRGLE